MHVYVLMMSRNRIFLNSINILDSEQNEKCIGFIVTVCFYLLIFVSAFKI